MAYLAVVEVDGLVNEGAEGAKGRPAELVAEWVVAAFRAWETAAPGLVMDDFGAFLCGFVDDLLGAKVVNAGVEPNFVEERQVVLEDLRR